MTKTTEFERAAEELTLLLLQLISWEEEVSPGLPKVQRSWKTFGFEILDALAQQGYLNTTHRANSAFAANAVSHTPAKDHITN